MPRLFLLAAVLVASSLGACSESRPATALNTPTSPVVPPAAPARLVVVTHTGGFRHDSIPAAEETLRQIGVESGLFTVEFCRTEEDVRARLSVAGLAGVDAVFFANTSGNLGIPDVQAFVDWVGSGKSFLGSHSASDTYHESASYLNMLGGEVLTHGSIVEAEVRVSEPANPAVAHLAPSFRLVDEWYRFPGLRSPATVLLKFDRNPPDGLGTSGAPVDLPLAWQKSHGSGRVFYTALGHRIETWQDARFRTHLREAIRWALRR